jgi:hypothetical protein
MRFGEIYQSVYSLEGGYAKKSLLSVANQGHQEGEKEGGLVA